MWVAGIAGFCWTAHTGPFTGRSAAHNEANARTPFASRHAEAVAAAVDTTELSDPASSRFHSPLSISKWLSKSTSAATLLSHFGDVMDAELFNEVHLATTFVLLARNEKSFDRRAQASPMFEELLVRTKDAIRKRALDAREIGNIFWAVASLSTRARRVRQLVPYLVMLVPLKVARMTPQHVANIMWASAKLDMRRKELDLILPHIVKKADKMADEFNGQDFGNMFWASVKLRELGGERIGGLLSTLATAAVDMVDEFEAQELSNTLWSIASMEAQDRTPELLKLARKLRSPIRRKAEVLTAQSVANLMWAIATLRNDVPKMVGLLPVLATQAVEVSTYCRPQHIAINLWSVGVTGVQLMNEREFIGEMTDRASSTIIGFTPQALSMACTGLARRGRQERDFLIAVAEHVADTLPDWSKKDMALSGPLILWAFATLKYPSPQLAELGTMLRPMLGDLSDWHICALAWSCPKLASAAEEIGELAKAATQEASRRGFSLEDVTERSRGGPPDTRRLSN